MKGIFENLIVPKRVLSEGPMERLYEPSGYYKRLPDRVADSIIDTNIDIDALNRNLEWQRDESFVRAFARLVLELRNDIGSVDTVLGDDTGGRLPAIFLHEVLSNYNKNKGDRKSGIFFIAGGRIEYYSDKEERKLALKDFLDMRKEHIGKTLFVTEYISTGEGIRWVGDIFEQVGIEYLLAAVSIRAPEHIENIPMATAMFQRMRYGSTGCIGAYYTHGMDASGVIKYQLGNSRMSILIIRRSHLRFRKVTRRKSVPLGTI